MHVRGEVEILPMERNEDIIKNGANDNECLGEKSEDEKLATKNSKILVKTEKKLLPKKIQGKRRKLMKKKKLH